MSKRFFLIFLLIALIPGLALAQSGTVTGKATTKSGEPLPAANVMIVGTTMGAATDADGVYTIENVPVGVVKVKISTLGYEQAVRSVEVVEGQTATVNFSLSEVVMEGVEISVLADRAKPRETPVAYTNVTKEEMELRLGSRDIPLVLDTTPSVYATDNGGGAGDARVNVRGFNQRNVAIMINGVPVNDMENGWVYWSNWDGVGDATSSIQVQRGLSAVNLATPSIGGTMNIITDPTAQRAGFKFKQEIGSDGFLKETLVAHTGILNDKFAFSGSVVRKTGDGFMQKTWTDAWAYYFGASFKMNKNHRFEFYALGAPQRHGQNSYKQNIAVYDTDFAKDLDDYDEAAFTAPLNPYNDYYAETDEHFDDARRYNENWGPVSSSYSGQQYWNGSTHDRYDEEFINERENYFHKPLVNFNWYATLSDLVSLYSTIYYSGGKGGGSGTYGSLAWDYTKPSRTVDFDATIERNIANATGSRGILRNSVNNQWTIGAISKARFTWNENMKSTFGVDWRTAEIEHFREVRDLLGGEYFYFDGNPFDSEADYQKGLGGKIDYNNTNTVDWFGFFGQTEYAKDQLSGYAMAGWSTIKYSFTDHFATAATLANGDPDLSSGELEVESDNISGYQIKGGASYKVIDLPGSDEMFNALDVYMNLGYVSKVPIFDHVIDDGTGTLADDPQNEKFTAIEGGINMNGMGGKLATKMSLYYTKWTDRTNTRVVVNEDLTEGIVFIEGMAQTHTGVEIEAAYQPIDKLRFDAMLSLGNWKYTDDVTGRYRDYSNDNPDVEQTYYVKDLKVGDAPQTQFAFTTSVYPVPKSQLQLVAKYFANNYADFNPFSRTAASEAEADREESWKAPSYMVLDLHANYEIPVNWRGVGLSLFAHVYNVLDEIYIQDAVDNSAYNSYRLDYDGDGRLETSEIVNPHSADAAEVFLGLPTRFNAGLTISY